MARCKNLVSVELSLLGRDFVKYSYTYRPAVNHEVKSVDHIRREYSLDGILQLSKLKSLHIEADGNLDWMCNTAPAEYLQVLEAGLKNLGQWFADEFGKRDQPVRISVHQKGRNRLGSQIVNTLHSIDAVV